MNLLQALGRNGCIGRGKGARPQVGKDLSGNLVGERAILDSKEQAHELVCRDRRL